MRSDIVSEYSGKMPKELKMLLEGAPDDDIGWALFMYLFRYSGRGNIITLGKISKFFDLDEKTTFERLNEMSALWVRQYLNTDGHGKIYYTYEVTDISADLMIKLVELLEIPTKNKNK